MGYVNENLMAGEHIVYRTALHWIIFIPPLLVMLVGLFFFSVSVTTGVVIILSGLFFTIRPLINYKTSEFAITDKRVMIKVGWLSRNTLETLLHKVENISVQQPITGRILGYGTISITGTGGTTESFKNITAPLQFRKHVQEQISGARPSGGAPTTL